MVWLRPATYVAIALGKFIDVDAERERLFTAVAHQVTVAPGSLT